MSALHSPGVRAAIPGREVGNGGALLPLSPLAPHLASSLMRKSDEFRFSTNPYSLCTRKSSGSVSLFLHSSPLAPPPPPNTLPFFFVLALFPLLLLLLLSRTEQYYSNNDETRRLFFTLFVHRSLSVSLCLSTARRRSMRGWPFSSLLASFLSWCSGSSTKPLSGLSSWVPLPFLLRLSFLTLSLSLFSPSESFCCSLLIHSKILFFCSLLKSLHTHKEREQQTVQP